MEENTALAAVETAGDTNAIIVVKQLPIIQEQLFMIKAEIERAVAEALAMEVTEDTVVAIKAKRAELNKLFEAFETKRKEVKAAILAPYDTFEGTYKDCVTSPFKTADAELRRRITVVEDGVKSGKQAEVAAYFAEYAESLGLDFVDFEQMGLKITLSDSLKKLKTAAKKWLDDIAGGVKMIATFQEHSDEIMAEFKKNGYDAPAATVTVANRHKAIEAERKAAEERRQREAEQAEREARMREQYAAAATAAMPQNEPVVVPDAVCAPTEQKPTEGGNGVSEEFIEPLAHQQEVFQATFTVYGTIEQLKAVKKFLIDGGYKYVAE